MTTIQLKLSDEISQLIDSFAKPKEVFVLEVVKEKIVRDKGIESLILAFERSLSKFPGICLRTVGPQTNATS